MTRSTQKPQEFPAVELPIDPEFGLLTVQFSPESYEGDATTGVAHPETRGHLHAFDLDLYDHHRSDSVTISFHVNDLDGDPIELACKRLAEIEQDLHKLTEGLAELDRSEYPYPPAGNHEKPAKGKRKKSERSRDSSTVEILPDVKISPCLDGILVDDEGNDIPESRGHVHYLHVTPDHDGYMNRDEGFELHLTLDDRNGPLDELAANRICEAAEELTALAEKIKQRQASNRTWKVVTVFGAANRVLHETPTKRVAKWFAKGANQALRKRETKERAVVVRAEDF